jgi:hypothetical protein
MPYVFHSTSSQVYLDTSDAELKEQMADAKGFMDLGAPKSWCRIEDYDLSQPESLDASELRGICKRMVDVGYIGLLSESSRNDPDSAGEGWGALEIWLCAEGFLKKEMVLDDNLMARFKSAWSGAKQIADHETLSPWWIGDHGGGEHPAMESHLAKYRSLIPTLALIIHLLSHGTGPVSLSALKKAIAWGRYLESHARRIYAGVTESAAIAAQLLAKRIQKGEVPDSFKARDVYRKGWTGLDKESVDTAIDVLLSLNWLEERIELTTGRPRTYYAINPKIEIKSKKELTKPYPSVSIVSSVDEDTSDFGDDNEESILS